MILTRATLRFPVFEQPRAAPGHRHDACQHAVFRSMAVVIRLASAELLLRDRLLPQPSVSCSHCRCCSGTAWAAAHQPPVAVFRALPDRHRVHAVRLLGHRAPAAGRGDLDFLFDPAVCHHGCAGAGRGGPNPALERGVDRFPWGAPDRAAGRGGLQRAHACGARSRRSQRLRGDQHQVPFAYRETRRHRALHHVAVGADVAGSRAVRVDLATRDHLALDRVGGPVRNRGTRSWPPARSSWAMPRCSLRSASCRC